MLTLEADVSLSRVAAHDQSMTLASVQPALIRHLLVKHTHSFNCLPVSETVSRQQFHLVASQVTTDSNVTTGSVPMVDKPSLMLVQ